MTNTTVLPDTDSLDDLDYEQPCIVKTGQILPGGGYGKITPCDKPAAWSANCPGCGDLSLVCHDHRRVIPGYQWVCPRCTRTSADLIGWRRL